MLKGLYLRLMRKMVVMNEVTAKEWSYIWLPRFEPS